MDNIQPDNNTSTREDNRLLYSVSTVRNFLQEYETSLSSYNSTQVTSIANSLQKEITSILHTHEYVREIQKQNVLFIRQFMEKHSVLFFMRHGEQQVNDETKKLSGLLRKIKQMQLPYNMIDEITDASIAESCGTALVLKWLVAVTGKKFTIVSSQNTRAAQVANIISQIADVQPLFDAKLNSINYPSNKSKEEILELLDENSQEQLAWKKDVIDKLCGNETFEKITNDVRNYITESLSKQNTITLYITHTQQINAADVEAGEAPTRLANLGFRIFSSSQKEKHSSVIFPQGFYQRI